MDCEKALQIFDKLLKEKNAELQVCERQDGEVLTDICKALFRGMWQGRAYKQIAQDSGYKKGTLTTGSTAFFSKVNSLLDLDVRSKNFYHEIRPLLEARVTEEKAKQAVAEIKAGEFQQRQAEALRDLQEILVRYEDDLLGLQRQACRRVRLKRNKIKTLPTLQGFSQEEPLLTVQKMPRQGDGAGALEQFAAYVLILTKDGNLVRALQSWGAQHYPSVWDQLVEESHRHNVSYRNRVQPSLLIELMTSTVGVEGQYQIKAWLVNDAAEYRDIGRGAQSLYLPEVSLDESYSLSEISLFLPLYLGGTGSV